MSERDPAVALRQMRDAARRAIEIARPMGRADLQPDRLETLALTRLLEILWAIVTNQLPPLVARLDEIMEGPGRP